MDEAQINTLLTAVNRTASELKNFSQKADGNASPRALRESIVALELLAHAVSGENVVASALQKLSATKDRVDALEAAGVPFQSAKAHAHIAKVASDIEVLVTSCDVNAGEARASLHDIVTRANQLHDSFPQA